MQEQAVTSRSSKAWVRSVYRSAYASGALRRNTTITTDRNRPTAIVSSVLGTHIDELAHLIVILHDSPLPRAGIYPCDKVLHVPSDEHGGVGDWLGAHSDVALLYGPNGLLVS